LLKEGQSKRKTGREQSIIVTEERCSMNNCTKKGKLGQRKHEDKTPDTEAETHQLLKHRIFNDGECTD